MDLRWVRTCDRRHAWRAVTLAGIVSLAFFLRVYRLDSNPPELFEDELAGAVSAWSIVTTGRDIEQTHPPFFTTRLELKQPLYYVATVVPRAFLGRESSLAIRLPAVAFGLATTALIWWIARLLGGEPAETLAAAALYAVTPWVVHYGRIGWEPAAFLAPTLAGVGLLWHGLDARRPRRILGGAAVLAVGAYAYHPALLMNAALAALAVTLHRRRLDRPSIRALSLGAGVAFVLLLPYLIALLSEPLFSARTRAVSTFADGLTAEAIGTAWANYRQQWSPRWLFLSPAPNLRYHPNVPVLFAWTAPFLALGIIRLLRRRARADLFILGWLLLGPLPAALTNDGVPHFARGMLALPPILLATAAGLGWTAGWVGRVARRRWIAAGAFVAVALVAAVSVATAYRTYVAEYPDEVAPAWHESPAGALRRARTIVPAGGTLCIDATDGVSYWTFPHTIAYYLAGRDFLVIQDLVDPRCAAPGSYHLYGLRHNPSVERAPVPARPVATVAGRRGEAMFVFMEVLAP